MTAEQQADYILNDCLLAAGQAAGCHKPLDHEAIVVWRDRFRGKFFRAIAILGNSWDADRDRLLAVSRYLGHRASLHAIDKPSIDAECAQQASTEIEAGCTMNARREAARATICTESPSSTF